MKIALTEAQTETQLSDPKTVAQFLAEFLKNNCDIHQEHFFVVGITRTNQVRFLELSGIGTDNSILIGVKNVFRKAVTEGVAGLLMAHNHPSGVLKASEEDINFTKKVDAAAEILEIKLIDHIIFSKDGSYLSFMLEGII